MNVNMELFGRNQWEKERMWGGNSNEVHYTYFENSITRPTKIAKKKLGGE
jgi:hypothetical protein